MEIFLILVALLVGISIVFLPLSTGFFPKLGLIPLKLGHRKSVRLVQVSMVWGLATVTLWIGRGLWGWIAVGIALWFTFVAMNFYPKRIFVALTNPDRSQDGLAESAPVLAIDVEGDVVAYPLELIVPHHIVNDSIGGKPVLVAW